MSNEQTSSRSQDKWIAAGMWLVLLIAAGFTSFTTVIMLPIVVIASLGAVNYVTVLGVGATVVVAYLIANTWLKFARLTNELLITYASLSSTPEEETSLFGYWLIFPQLKDHADGDQEIDLEPQQAESSLVGEVLRYLGYVWVAMLLSSALVLLLTSFLRREYVL